ncbi:MAG: outer membrane beta-barrel protein [Candidatus Eisenbacteria bacterium]
MNHHVFHPIPGGRTRVAVLVFVALACMLVPVLPAGAVQLIPSIGLTKAVDDRSGDAKAYGSLALRSSLAPFLDFELGIAYREQSYFDDQLKLRMWPVTASAWVRPVPTLYAGAGVGYYPTTFDYADAVPIEDSTSDRLGVHLGAGVDLPLGPRLALDLHGRYIMLREQHSRLVPETFDPDFWNASLGLAIKF